MKKYSKFAVLLTAFAAVLLSACNATKSVSPKIVRFERQGGGNLEFLAQMNTAADTLFVTVDRMEFRDTTITTSLVRNTDNSAVFDVINSLAINEITKNVVTESKKDARGRILCTGTWTHFYLNTDTGLVEIRNKKLLKKLSPLEDLVRQQICGE